jgi:hypothetical protein
MRKSTAAENFKVLKGRTKASVVPAGLGILRICPGIEMPGYFQMFLWNKASFSCIRWKNPCHNSYPRNQIAINDAMFATSAMIANLRGCSRVISAITARIKPAIGAPKQNSAVPKLAGPNLNKNTPNTVAAIEK